MSGIPGDQVKDAKIVGFGEEPKPKKQFCWIHYLRGYWVRYELGQHHAEGTFHGKARFTVEKGEAASRAAITRWIRGGGKCRCARKARDKSGDQPDWNHTCEVCGATPVHPHTGLCGPCTFGEASTAGGNW